MPVIHSNTNSVDYAPNSGVWSQVRSLASKPYVFMKWNINPLSPSTDGPADALRRINESANRGLQRAALSGVKIEPVAGHFHRELNQLLAQPRKGHVEKRDPTETVGPVANVRPTDPEITRAIPLQVRVEDTDWKGEMDKHREDLTAKLSAFSAALIMRSLCTNEDNDNATLLKIAGQVTKPEETASLWDLFTSNYQPTFFQKLKAGLFYWVCYKTSLITNTVKSYLKSFVDSMTEDFPTDDSQTWSKLIKKLLENTHEFLIQDIGASKAFALAVQPDGDVEKYRKRAIEKHYGNSLEGLCRTFSKKVVNDEYTVPFFEAFQKIPVIGYVFQAFQWLINKIVIRNVMKFFILPPALKSAVENGIEATEPHNLPFALAITKFLNKQMDNLREKLDSPSTTPPPPQLPGTELLSPVIKELKMVLDLEPLKTQHELRQKFQEFKNEKWFKEKFVEESIQDGIKDGCYFLFDFLNETAKSRELFAHALRNACDLFAVHPVDRTALMAEFNEEQLKLKRTSREIFEKLIDKTVEKKVSPIKPEEKAKQITKEAFADGQIVAKKTFDELTKLCEQMNLKVANSSNIQTEIASFLQIMQVAASRKETHERIEKLEPVDRDAIWRLSTPLFEKAAHLEERLLHLQELQDYYTSHVEAVKHLNTLKEVLETVHNQLDTQPRHLGKLIDNLQKPCKEIRKILGERAPLTRHLEAMIKEISDLSEAIAKEQQVIVAIHAFYPPRLPNQQVEQEGLLEQLLNYQRGIHVPGFQPKACLKEIGKYLEFFSPDEQKSLRELIDDGSHLEEKWPRLSLLLQRIYEAHREIKDRDSATLNEKLRTAEQWSREKIAKYTQVKDQDHAQMQREMRDVSTEVNNLRNDAYKAQLNLPFHFTSSQIKTTAAIAGAVIGVGLTPLGAIGAGIGAALFTGARNLSGLSDKKSDAIGKTAGSLAAGAAAAYLFPAAAPLISLSGATLTGWNYDHVAHKTSQDEVLPKVMEIFDNAHALLTRSSRIWLATSTRAMQAMTSSAG